METKTNMEVIKSFTEEFLKAEALASDALIKPNLEDYNAKLEIMNSYCIEELQNHFGMLPLTELWDDDFYEEWKDHNSSNPRDIYKISQYIDNIYGEVYVVYISPRNPNNIVFLYSGCVFVAKMKSKFKIIKKYSFGDSMRIKDKFEAAEGLEDISFETLQKPVAIERYKEPEDDEDAMEHYLMDI